MTGGDALWIRPALSHLRVPICLDIDLAQTRSETNGRNKTFGGRVTASRQLRSFTEASAAGDQRIPHKFRQSENLSAMVRVIGSISPDATSENVGPCWSCWHLVTGSGRRAATMGRGQKNLQLSDDARRLYRGGDKASPRIRRLQTHSAGCASRRF